MMDDIERIQSDRDHYNDENMVDIDTLKTDESYIRECVLWIKAFTTSDFRIGCTHQALYGSPMPSCWMHITSLHPLDENKPQLMNLDALCFVILLATAMRLSSTRERFSLQIVHELHAHADGSYDWLDFDELQHHGETMELDEPFLRFALAWVGIKRARTMYRDSGQRAILPFQKKDDVATQSKSLLQSIETFANEQCQYCPESPVGLWNLGWVTHQVKHNGKHPWRAANDLYNQMADCCLLADKADDDFYRAEAGIEMAMSLVLGGKPIVGYSVPSGSKVQVRRDMNVIDIDDEYREIGASTPAAANEAGAKERKRLRDGVPPTLLEPGETVLVPHWEVSCIWNYAMKAYMRLETFGYGSFVYGETIGWNIAEGFLTGKYAGELVRGRYNTCPQIGLLCTRDKGSFPCGCCGKVESNLKQCSVCKKAQYCSRDCQKKAWKTHKRECTPAVQ